MLVVLGLCGLDGGSQGLYSSLGCGVSCHTEILSSYRKIWEAVKDDGGRLSSTAE
jgi:hypothetical protein